MQKFKILLTFARVDLVIKSRVNNLILFLISSCHWTSQGKVHLERLSSPGMSLPIQTTLWHQLMRISVCSLVQSQSPQVKILLINAVTVSIHLVPLPLSYSGHYCRVQVNLSTLYPGHFIPFAGSEVTLDTLYPGHFIPFAGSEVTLDTSYPGHFIPFAGSEVTLATSYPGHFIPFFCRV